MRKMFYCSLLLLGVAVQIQTANSYQSPISRIDDLPTNLKPINYELQMMIDLANENVPFMGNVLITIECAENTKEIILNVKDLKILKSQVGLTDKDSEQSLIIEGQDYKPAKDQYVITLVDELITGRTYLLYVPYKKEVSIDFSDRGYMQYDYGDNPDEPKKTIALTIADINDTRRFLPCMDQISLKATFKVRLTVPDGMSAFTSGSMEFKKDTRFISNKYTNTWSAAFEFENSLPLSTYTLAIVVAKLSPVELTEPLTETKVTILSDAEVLHKMDSTRQAIFRAFKFYIDYFKMESIYASPVESLTVLILPNLPEMKTEKNELILLDETAVSPTDPSDSDYDNKTDIALLVCNAVFRQWIGAGATMSEWNEYWAQVALATFLRAPCVNKIIPKNKSDLLSWQLVESYTHVLEIDGESMSRPVHVPKDEFDLAEAFTDSVLVEKAHLLIRMAHFFMGAYKFQEGVKRYYYEFQLENSTLDEMWQKFEEARPKKALWPQNVTFKNVLDSWSRKKGFPLVTMKRDYATKSVTLIQERFVQLGEEEEPKIEANLKTNLWIIPLRYIMQTELMQNKQILYPVNLWLKDAETTISNLEEELILINLELNVLCRVQYDLDDWNRIRDILRNKKTCFLIHEMSRVNLVSDMFALAEVGKLTYEFLVSTMTYLPHEIWVYPLMVALKEFNKIRSSLFGTDALEPYDKYLKEILTPIFNRDRFVNISEMEEFDRQENKLKKLIIEMSCNVGVEVCIKQCRNLFQEWIKSTLDDKDDPIPEDIRGVVLCQAIKHGDQKEWSFVFTQYEQNPDQNFRETILTALGCTKKAESLKIYLGWTMNPRYKYTAKEKLTVFSSLASNEKGYEEMKYFIKSQLHTLIEQFDGYKGIIGSYLAKLFEVTYIRKDFVELKKLTRSVKDHVRDSENLLLKSMKMAERNILWRKMHEETLTKLFQNPIDLATTSRAEV